MKGGASDQGFLGYTNTLTGKTLIALTQALTTVYVTQVKRKT